MSVAPARIKYPDIENHWLYPPTEPSARCKYWLDKIANGWVRNKRIKALCYYSSAEYFGVYIWEWNNVLAPILRFAEGEKELAELTDCNFPEVVPVENALKDPGDGVE